MTSTTSKAGWVACFGAACLAFACGSAMAKPVADTGPPAPAAHGADVQGLVGLARNYEMGDGVPQDFSKSNELYCKAAARGDAESLVRLAFAYSSGRELQADEGVAALLLNRAAELGHERAKELLQHVSGRAGSVMPTCMNEAANAAAAETTAAEIARPKTEIEALVYRLAPQYSIDPQLALAVVAAESAFQVNAVSPKNAQGLMQLIPATAERFGVKKAFNPVENLKGGLAYLQWLMAHFEGDVALVLAAYNAGEEAVAKHRGIPPFAETRNYVRRVTSVYKKAIHPYLAHVAAPSPALGSIRRAAASAPGS